MKRSCLDISLVARHKGGFTLMELMVYIAILGIVVIIAGQAFSDSTKIRVRTQSMLKANEVAENVGTILREDVAQMGAKSAYTSGGSEAYESKAGLVYMSVGAGTTTPDSSSFNYSKGKFGTDRDSIAFRRIRYNDDGSFAAVEEISWFLRGDGILRRTCNLIGDAGTVTGACAENGSVEMAENVAKFIVTPAKPSVTNGSELLFPVNSDVDDKSFRLISYTDDDDVMRANITPIEGNETVTVSGFASNYHPGVPGETRKRNELYVADITTGTSDLLAHCKRVNIKKDSVYEISFSLAYKEDESRMFRAGVDHMAVGVRRMDDENSMFPDVPDFAFYPPQFSSGSGERSVRFSTGAADAKNGTDVCFVFTFSFYSPTVSTGSLSIKDLAIKRYGQDYVFDDTYTPTIVDKKSIRAFRVNVVVKRNGEEGVYTTVVPVPSNGVKG